MESCHELLGEIIPPKRECVVARLKRRFEGYRSRHAEAVPRHQQRSESLYNQEKEHTQQLQQRFLESKTKKSKKDKSLVTGSQAHRGASAHYVHGASGASHQAHPQQPLQYLDNSSTRVVSTASPISHPVQGQQQIRQGLPQDERQSSSLDDSTKCSASAAVVQRTTRDEKDSFDDLLRNTTSFPHIKQEIPTRLDGGRRVDYNESSNPYLKSEVVRSGFMCGSQNSSADFLPESFANFPDGSLNPDVLRDLIADVAGNAGELMADFNFDEVKSAPSGLDVMASEDQGGKHQQHANLQHQRHHQQSQQQLQTQQQQQQQQQQKTIQLASCPVPLMSSNETSCQSSISPFQNSPRQPSSPQGQIRGSRNTDSPVQKTHQTQQKSSGMPPSSMTPPSSSSSAVPSVASTAAPPYPMIPRSPLNSVSNQTTFGSAIMSSSVVASRASPNTASLVSGGGGGNGVSMPAATTCSQQTSAIPMHAVISQPKLVMNVSGNTAGHAGGFNQSQLDSINKNVVGTIGYTHNQPRTNQQQQQSAYINNTPSQTSNMPSCDGRTLVLNAQFQEAAPNRIQMLQQQQMIRRESTPNQQQQPSAVFAHQQPGHMTAQQQHHDLPKSQSRLPYQRHLTANENANLSPIHHQNQQQQQQQHIQNLRQQQQRQQQLQHHRSHHSDDAGREEVFGNEVQRNPKTVPSNISSNPSFVEALAFNASATATERTLANAHSIMHLQQQQQRQPQLCNQFRSMTNEQNHTAYQNSGEQSARGLSSGLSQRAQHRAVYNNQSPAVAPQWQQQYSGHCTQTNGPQNVMSMQQNRNGGVNSTNPMMMSRQNAESHDHGRHASPFHPGVEQRTIGNASSSIDFNNLEFLTGVETGNNELLNFDAASSALKMLDDVLGHQNVASTYKG